MSKSSAQRVHDCHKHKRKRIGLRRISLISDRYSILISKVERAGSIK